MVLFRTFLFSSVLVFISCKPTTQITTLVLHESRDSIPDGFVFSSPAPIDQMVNLRLALVQGNMAGLEAALYDVSVPSSPLYGIHLTKEEVEAYVMPSSETTSVVIDWLKSNSLNFSQASPAGDWLTVSMPVNKVETLFDTKLSTFTHESSGKQFIRTLAYSIPANLKDHLDFVYPMISFSTPFTGPVITSPFTPKIATSNNISSRATPASCENAITPACLQDLYNISTTLATQTENQLGVSGFIEQFANEADLKTFLLNLRPDLSSSTTFSLQTLDGGENLQNANEAGIEANLDIQYTVGLASGVPTIFISVGEDNSDGALDGFLDIINFLLAESSPPQVLTTSYGQNENTLSRSLATQLCNAYMQLGARGTTILFSSGDGGVSGSQSSSCTSFVPTFPSTCPFVTSVGATTGVAETAASFSSGGFSNFFAQPSYQLEAVSSYLSNLGSTNSGKFNVSGRAYPDVSAQGVNVEIVVGGEAGLVSGTSCSSPIFASVIALLNDRLLAACLNPLGFLNPFLYTTGVSALNDITTGSNPGCNTNGFPAKIGWDPVTGLGSPNFAKLLVAVGL